MNSRQHLLPPSESEGAALREAATQRSTWVSVFVNLALTATQFLMGLMAHSQGLIADAIHSLSDLFADFVVLLAAKKSQKGPDEDHHYGHMRYENIASLVLGGLLLAVGVGLLGPALAKLRAPESIPAVHPAALWVALGALVTKELLFRYMLAVANRVKSSMLIANAWHARSDAASSFVVAVGIVGNLLGYPLFDPLAAIVVGAMVAKMGWSFAWDATHDLADRAATSEHTREIEATLLATAGVQGVHDLRTRKAGDWILVDVHLEIDGSLTVYESHEIARQARLRVLAAHPVLSLMIHVDPAAPQNL